MISYLSFLFDAEMTTTLPHFDEGNERADFQRNESKQTTRKE